MIRYFAEHWELFGTAFAEHLYLVFVTLFFSLLLAALISGLILRKKWLSNGVVQIFSAVYSIPSLALFAILIPIFGLGNQTAVIVLVIYNQYLLIRNILAGIWNIDATILEAGIGMGMSRWQLARTIQIPLAMPSILAGIRLAIISTTGIATIAATINAGGLGTVLFSGLRTMNVYKIVWGTILSMVIALGADVSLKKLEELWRRKGEAGRKL
ncbi:ABC transporter permease [Lachnospiraceae bacterium KK002]